MGYEVITIVIMEGPLRYLRKLRSVLSTSLKVSRQR